MDSIFEKIEKIKEIESYSNKTNIIHLIDDLLNTIEGEWDTIKDTMSLENINKLIEQLSIYIHKFSFYYCDSITHMNVQLSRNRQIRYNCYDIFETRAKLNKVNQ